MSLGVQLPPYAAWALLLALLGLWLTHRLTVSRTPRKKPHLVPRLVMRSAVRGVKDFNDSALVIQNESDTEIRDFELRLLLAEGQQSPVWGEDRKPTERVTIPIIYPGQRFEWLAVFYVRAPTEFDAVWGWAEGRRRRVERRGKLRLERL